MYVLAVRPLLMTPDGPQIKPRLSLPFMGPRHLNVLACSGLPRQTNKQWEYTLKKAISTDAAHISVYDLQVGYSADHMNFSDFVVRHRSHQTTPSMVRRCIELNKCNR